MNVVRDSPSDGPDALFAWARAHTPSLERLWNELAADWSPETPTDTDVILFVLVPGLLDAVRQRDMDAARESAAIVEAMATQDAFMENHVAVTLAPALAAETRPEDVETLLTVLGPATRGQIEYWLHVDRHRD